MAVNYVRRLEGFGSTRGEDVRVTAENGCVMVIDHKDGITVALRAHEWAPFMRALAEAMWASRDEVHGVDGDHDKFMAEVRSAVGAHSTPLLSTTVPSGDGSGGLVDDWDFDQAIADQRRREAEAEAARQKAEAEAKAKRGKEVEEYIPF